MLELYQAEWCPSSHRVRERLTELGVDYVARQVPVAREARDRLRRVTGAETIPTLVLEDGTAVVGADAIGAYLDGRFEEPLEAEMHRRRAAELSGRGWPPAVRRRQPRSRRRGTRRPQPAARRRPDRAARA
jgi:glutathione S-transferase